MKIKILTILILIASISNAQIGYVSLAANQGVSYQDLQDAVNNGYLYPTGTAIPIIPRLISKANVGTYVYIYATNSYLSAMTDSQCVSKQSLTPTYSSNSTIDFASGTYTPFFYGYNTSADACTHASAVTGYTAYWNGTFAVNTLLDIPGFVNSMDTTKWVYVNSNPVQIKNGAYGRAVVAAVGSCGVTTNVYLRSGDRITGSTNSFVQWSSDNSTWVNLVNFYGLPCTNRATITASSGTIYIRIVNGGGQEVGYEATNGASVCIANNLTPTYGSTGRYSIAYNAYTDISITIDSDGSNYILK